MNIKLYPIIFDKSNIIGYNSDIGSID